MLWKRRSAAIPPTLAIPHMTEPFFHFRARLPNSVEWIKRRNSGGCKVGDIARYHRQSVFECGRGDCEIHALVANARGETSPAAGDTNIHRQNSVAVGAQRDVQPAAEFLGEIPVGGAPLLDAEFDFPDGHHADEQVGRRYRPDPGYNARIAPALAQFRQHDGVKQVHQKPGSRRVPSSRSKPPSSVGMASKCSVNLRAEKRSSCFKRSYSTASITTTAGFPCFVTV